MDRKAFIKTMLVGGVCSCAIMPSTLLSATEKKREKTKKEPKPDNVANMKLQAVQIRMAKLIDILDETVGTPALEKVLTEMGNECSMLYQPLFKSYKNDIQGFLKMMRKQWHMSSSHDEKAKTIIVKGPATGSCVCPFVDGSKMSDKFCNCSLGWQKKTFTYILGKQTKGKILESVLRGSKRCSFEIKYT